MKSKGLCIVVSAGCTDLYTQVGVVVTNELHKDYIVHGQITLHCWHCCLHSAATSTTKSPQEEAVA